MSDYAESVLTRPQITLSLVIFLAAIVGVGAAVGHAWTGLGVAAFALTLVAIDAKPSSKRIFNTARSGGDRDGVFARAWHRTAGWNSRDDDPASSRPRAWGSQIPVAPDLQGNRARTREA